MGREKEKQAGDKVPQETAVRVGSQPLRGGPCEAGHGGARAWCWHRPDAGRGGDSVD